MTTAWPTTTRCASNSGSTRSTASTTFLSDTAVQAALAAAYDTVDDIDLWVGGLAEDHVPGASVGELVQTILVDQFTRLRDGDRFWYERLFSGRELRKIDNTTLADVIQRNTDIENLPDNVFFVDGTDTPSREMVSGVGANSPLAASISETPSEILFNANRLPDQVEVGLPVEVATGEADENLSEQTSRPGAVRQSGCIIGSRRRS